MQLMKQLANQLKRSIRRAGPKTEFRRTAGESPIQIECGFKNSKSAFVVHGLHKSATMFLYQFFADLCSQIDTPIFSIHNQTPDHQTVDETIEQSFVLCPVRSFDTQKFSFPLLNCTRHMFQIRDPRDVLVSEYYSIGWRHSVAGWSQEDLERRELIRTLSVDEYAMREPEISTYPLIDRIQPLIQRTSMSKTNLPSQTDHFITKYETMVTDFPQWVSTVLPALDIESSGGFAASLVEKYRNDFRADDNNSGHRRNVTPGDHREKLAGKTVETLNQRFASVLTAFEYN